MDLPDIDQIEYMVYKCPANIIQLIIKHQFTIIVKSVCISSLCHSLEHDYLTSVPFHHDREALSIQEHETRLPSLFWILRIC